MGCWRQEGYGQSIQSSNGSKKSDMFKEIKFFVTYLLIWISTNLSIPFWMLGHFHLMTNVYQDILEIIASFGMNILVFIGFLLDYKQQRKNNG
jgi:hypothetical protein